MRSRSYCEISLSAIAHNVKEIQKRIPPNTEIMGIVKANAYGAGDIKVYRVLANLGVKTFAVATIEEALHLRENGCNEDILILGHTSFKEVHLLKKYNLIQSVFSFVHAKHLADNGIRVHFKIDTGMGRMGFVYREQQKNTEEIISALKLFEKVEGIFSHFAVSDSKQDEDIIFTHQQIELFEELKKKIKEAGIHIPTSHIQNSYGIINFPNLKYDFVRPGILLLGSKSLDNLHETIHLDLKPAVTWKCKVGLIKEIEAKTSISYGRTFIASQKMKVATITVGYADGYPRALSNKGYVLINGHRCNILGRVCMDQMVVDVTGVDVEIDDEVILIGKSKTLEIKTEDLAALADTISNDIYCMISERVERLYYE